MCFPPQRRAIFPDRNSKNGSEHEVFCTFWLTNVLRATAACHFSGSQLQKWLRAWGVLYILAYKCASRHSGVPFFRIATPKMAPSMRCFVHFGLQMCFPPQRRAIFPDRNSKNGSEHEVFCTFWLTNVLRATAACNFSGSQLQKWLRAWGVLYILAYKCASRHSGVPFFRIATSKMAPTMRCFVHFDPKMCFAPQRRAIFHSWALLSSYLRTRRFNEATFRTAGTTNHWKNTGIRDVANIWRALSFFLVTLHACWSSC